MTSADLLYFSNCTDGVFKTVAFFWFLTSFNVCKGVFKTVAFLLVCNHCLQWEVLKVLHFYWFLTTLCTGSFFKTVAFSLFL